MMLIPFQGLTPSHPFWKIDPLCQFIYTGKITTLPVQHTKAAVITHVTPFWLHPAHTRKKHRIQTSCALVWMVSAVTVTLGPGARSQALVSVVVVVAKDVSLWMWHSLPPASPTSTAVELQTEHIPNWTYTMNVYHTEHVPNWTHTKLNTPNWTYTMNVYHTEHVPNWMHIKLTMYQTEHVPNTYQTEHVYTHMHTHTYTHTHKHAHVHIPTHVHMYIHMHTHTTHICMPI